MNKISDQEQSIRSDALHKACQTAYEKGIRMEDIVPLAETFFAFLSGGSQDDE